MFITQQERHEIGEIIRLYLSAASRYGHLLRTPGDQGGAVTGPVKYEEFLERAKELRSKLLFDGDHVF